MPEDSDQAAQRRRMVEHDLAARDIHNGDVLRAMASVPREKFVHPDQAADAYWDGPLNIGAGQTISQPYIVALMIQALLAEPIHKALEIGVGSGYAAAVLSLVAEQVFGVERDPGLASTARSRFEQLGYTNIEVRQGDGSLGWSEHAPYDAILVSAGAPDVPSALYEQLEIGGRLVIPVGADLADQHLICLTRGRDGSRHQTSLGAVRFVPLRGAQGF